MTPAMNPIQFIGFSLLLIFSGIVAAQNTPSESASPNEKTAGKQEKENAVKTIEEKTKGMKRVDGFVPFYWDEKSGKVFLEIGDFESELLYVNSLATGLGSNPVGLDRGKLGGQRVIQFRRVGPKILMLQRNLRFRANTKNRAEQRAVEQSFAQSVIWGGKVEAETEGKVLVDFTNQLMTDVQGVAGTLARTGQGDFSVDKERSAVYLPRCKGFPENTELEATLTFKGRKPGSHVRQTAPTANSVTLRQHHSFVKLPDLNYRPREFDARCPSMAIRFSDYATALDAPLEKRWILRHRLVKKNPEAAVSEPVEPIVYYVDSGAPPLIKEALLEGASWWNQAFEAAGFKDAFVVKVLPEDADPLDVRYNVIQWVHRSTRGWSYGGSVSDPRTGEIIKGHVTLGSLRVRQDRMIFESMNQKITSAESPSLKNCGIAGVESENALVHFSKNDPVEVALARIRQLSAHEVGHTLGFVHNFAASTYDDRASVMDYPAPRVKITADQKLDFSDAYAVGIGSWDKISVRYAYTQFPAGADEQAELEKILGEAETKKMLFISDSDSRPGSASHPKANLWDNGENPTGELEHLLKVRQIALSQFDPSKLPSRTTTSDIEQYYVPLYLQHRYQINAVGKVLGGYEYRYGYTDLITKRKPVAPEEQAKAIALLIRCLDSQQLRVAPEIASSISPSTQSTIRSTEFFDGQTGRDFDEFEPPRVLIGLVLDELLNVERLNRLGGNDHQTAEQFLGDLTEKLCRSRSDGAVGIKDASKFSAIDLRNGRLKRQLFVERLMKIVDAPNASVDSSSAALKALKTVQQMLSPKRGPSATLVQTQASREEQAFRGLIDRKIQRFLNRPYEVAPQPNKTTVPPGSPIGNGG